MLRALSSTLLAFVTCLPFVLVSLVAAFAYLSLGTVEVAAYLAQRALRRLSWRRRRTTDDEPAAEPASSADDAAACTTREEDNSLTQRLLGKAPASGVCTRAPATFRSGAIKSRPTLSSPSFTAGRAAAGSASSSSNDLTASDLAAHDQIRDAPPHHQLRSEHLDPQQQQQQQQQQQLSDGSSSGSLIAQPHSPSSSPHHDQPQRRTGVHVHTHHKHVHVQDHHNHHHPSGHHHHQPPPPSPPPVVLSWPGRGIMFFWQAGVLKYLQERYDLTSPHVHMAGSSAGSFISAFAKCGVDIGDAVSAAHAVSVEAELFTRPLGLLGAWGAVVRSWLDRLLPPDAAERCSRGASVVVSHVTSLAPAAISRFTDRNDLLEVLMASAHVPFLLDWRACAPCRGHRSVDGSWWLVLRRARGGLVPPGARHVIVIDAKHDKRLLARDPWLSGSLSLMSLEGVLELMDLGYRYASRLDEEQGTFSRHLPPAVPPPPTGGASALLARALQEVPTAAS